MNQKRGVIIVRKKHTVLKVISIIFVLVIIAVASIAYAAYRNVESTFSTSYENFPKTTSIDLKSLKHSPHLSLQLVKIILKIQLMLLF